MKKFGLGLLMLLLCRAAYALPIGNPSEASLFFRGRWLDSYCCDPCDPCFSWCDAWSLRVGYYGDFVFNRHLELSAHHHAGHIAETELFTNACYLVFNICNRLDFFGTVGETHIHIRTNAQAWNFPGSLMSELFFGRDFSWSIGARATLWQCDFFTLGIEGQYFETTPDIDHFLEYENGTLTYFNPKKSVPYTEWQVGLGLAYRFATRCPTIAMVPYAAVKWAGAKLHLGNFSFTRNIAGVPRRLTFPDLSNGKLWGYAVGMSLTLCDMVGMTVEGRFGDEKAVYVNGGFRF